MNKPVPSALPGVISLVGWLTILGGFAFALFTLWDEPGNLTLPLGVFFGGVYFGTAQLGLAGVLTRLGSRDLR